MKEITVQPGASLRTQKTRKIDIFAFFFASYALRNLNDTFAQAIIIIIHDMLFHFHHVELFVFLQKIDEIKAIVLIIIVALGDLSSPLSTNLLWLTSQRQRSISLNHTAKCMRSWECSSQSDQRKQKKKKFRSHGGRILKIEWIFGEPSYFCDETNKVGATVDIFYLPSDCSSLR